MQSGAKPPPLAPPPAPQIFYPLSATFLHVPEGRPRRGGKGVRWEPVFSAST